MNRLVQRLNRWANLLDTAGAEAVFASARSGAELARALVPVDSGALRASVSVEAIGPLAAAVTAAAPHAAAVEFGTRNTAPQPYLLPMARQVQPEFVQAMAEAIREVLA